MFHNADLGRQFQGLGAMRGKLNLDYKISDVPHMRHRALYLYNPAVDMTGEYTCKVSTLKNEVAMTKRMVVYGERSELRFVSRGESGRKVIDPDLEQLNPAPEV